MSDVQNNKRIAKNTLLLYARMLFMMAVSLYTSRVILSTLGVEDYGIYNVVGGVIVVVASLTSSMGGATSRYITVALGQENIDRLKFTFSNLLFIHIVISGVILCLGETIGLWFVLHKLTIPPERLIAAIWVYQCTVISTVFSFMMIPYNSVIIAHERMSAFAYLSIVEVVFKLLIVYLLLIQPFDRLIAYALLLLVVQIIIMALYFFYCRKNFIESRERPVYDKPMFKEMFAYAGWTTNGSLAVMGYTQGLNILLNLFFGPVVNAARGIAVQVQAAARNFCGNFQMAVNPQITKCYAKGDLCNMHRLVIRSSKFSYYIMLFVAVPLMLEAPKVLRWWLGEYPEHTVSFLCWMIAISMLETLKNPIITSVHATGKIKRFQLIEATMLLAIVPIAYLALKLFHLNPEVVFIVHFVVEMLTQLARLFIVLPLISMSLKQYFSDVLLPIISVTLAAPVIPVVISTVTYDYAAPFFLTCFTSVICCAITMFYVGCTAGEKTFLKTTFQKGFLRLQDVFGAFFGPH